MTKEQFIEHFHSFLQPMYPNKELGELNGSTNLMEVGYLDSLSMVELIIYLESLIGEEISIENYQLKNFYTINEIFDTFIDGKILSGKDA